ncbi:hypothetical protein Taro_013542 [Colocasia esculenta]|uniref:Uncharacterized protein n=1 Tax=Colocasia esculenta TaxID=4460 RepID=A0A843UMF4_COLES|nr:hypothetical protein [Colocasia esculenta]
MAFSESPVVLSLLLLNIFGVWVIAQPGLAYQTPKHPSALVPSASTQLQYHRGPLLTSPINVYLVWYGAFSPADKSAISDFFASFDLSPATAPHGKQTVSTWWKTAQRYRDTGGRPVSSAVKLAGHVSDPGCSLGKSLKRADVSSLARNAVLKQLLPYDAGGVYLVLTAADVTVERFCMGSCGFHGTVTIFPGRPVAVVAHVGNAATQCPGLCAWPFAVPAYGPPGPPLVAPNGVGADGVVMNVATVLTGAATNPRGNGYYQGDALAPLEAVTACPGVFGEGAYPGYPGQLMVDPKSRASFNAYGAQARMFLLPAMWDPSSFACNVSGA